MFKDQDQKKKKEHVVAQRKEGDFLALEKELEILKKKAADYLHGWQRAKADYINFKRQIKEEQSLFVKLAHAEILLNILPIVDDFEHALRHLPEDLENNPWVEGVKRVYQKLQKLLTDLGCEEIKAKGEKFNPEIHEAVAKTNEVANAGEIVEVLQKGYKLHGRLLRPAKVKVAQ